MKQKRLRKILIRRVMGNSMLPMLRPGRLVVAIPGINRLKANQVVVVNHESIEKIKRIESIEANRLFIVGDNKSLSRDSRSFGWVPIDTVIGRVVWPRV